MKMIRILGWTLVVIGFAWLTHFSVIAVYSHPSVNPHTFVTLAHFDKPVPAETVNTMIRRSSSRHTLLIESRKRAFPPAVMMLLGTILLTVRRKNPNKRIDDTAV